MEVYRTLYTVSDPDLHGSALFLEAGIRIRIRIRMKSCFRIRIKVKNSVSFKAQNRGPEGSGSALK
jgi:hypothetical protein